MIDQTMPMKLERKHAFPLTFGPLLIAVGFILFKLFTASKTVNPETGRISRIALNPEQETRLGLEAYLQVKKDHAAHVLTSGDSVERVRRVTEKLAKAAARKTTLHFDWDVSVFGRTVFSLL
jgi:predicted Zn-dependent protease